jgi:PAS domain S-box-containing protein
VIIATQQTLKTAPMSGRIELHCEQLVEVAPDAIVVVNRDGLIVLANRQAERMFGHRRDKLVGKPVPMLGPERFRATWTQLAGAAGRRLDGVVPNGDLGLVGLDIDGTEFPVEVTVGFVEVEDDAYAMLAIRNISERRKVEDELNSRIQQQALVAELGRSALIGVDFHKLMTEAAELMTSNLGVELSSVLELLPDGSVLLQAGRGWNEGLVGRTVAQSTSATPAAVVLITQTPIIVEDFETDARFPDASYLREHGVVSSLNVPLYGHNRPFGVLSAHTTRRRRFTPEDIHFAQSVANVLSAAIERKWHEQSQRDLQLSRAEQMMAIGQVAAGVAHELRNPLTSIKGLIQVNLREAQNRKFPAEDLAVIEHEIRRMERTLQTFLDFARPPQPKRQRLSLDSVVERVSALVAGRAKKQRAAIRFLPSDAMVWVDADQDQLQQLLLNLVLNALDAMPQGGAVNIDLRSPLRGFVELHVRDSGPGIAPHILPKLFETFVSSKETGMGLGLPVSKRIAEDHGGNLSAYNLPEGGACFVIRLPAAGQDQPGSASAG